MTRRRILCGLLLASALLACFAGWLWIASRPRVTRERFEQVKRRMSREEVIRTVGGPPGDYTSGRYLIQPDSLGCYASVKREAWLCDNGELLVRFDDADTAAHVVVREVKNLGPPPLTERIRRWLGL
jgi:hypothetical protein